MTEKRFTLTDNVGMLDVACGNIYDNGKFIGTVQLCDGDKFVELLNMLHEENQQLKKSIDYHLNVCKIEKKKITDIYDWEIPRRQGKTVSNELLLKYIGAIEVLEQIKKELKGDVE